MKIDFSPEQAQIVAMFMKMQAEHGLKQAAEMKAQAEAAASIAQKMAGGSVDLEELEIRTLRNFLGSLDVIAGMAPGLIKDEAAAQLKELLPRMDTAKKRLDN